MIRGMAALLLCFLIPGCKYADHEDGFHMRPGGPDDRIEIGGPYAGIEMHHSSPAIQRISFFHPRANSLDRSTDYWHRDTTRVYDTAIRINGGEPVRLFDTGGNYRIHPFSAEFERKIGDVLLTISYRFSGRSASVLLSCHFHNRNPLPVSISILHLLDPTLRTSHSFIPVEPDRIDADISGNAVIASYEDPRTGGTAVMIAGLSEDVEQVFTGRNADRPDSDWGPEAGGRACMGVISSFELPPDQHRTSDVLIAANDLSGISGWLSALKESYLEEIESYEAGIHTRINRNYAVRTGIETLDDDIRWARAILEVNRHYLDGVLVPMPCPAEYNFYFTHDALVTDLAAVHFDAGRVRDDLLYIASHSRADSVIPHAYYWRDSAYVTEYAGEDNWNHFWFVIVSAGYLRHTGDLEILRQLYPLLDKSLRLFMTMLRKDHLMEARHPDWWDIGSSRGARAYMSILAIRAIGDFIYISSRLQKDPVRLQMLEQKAGEMRTALNEQLWDDSRGYLINEFRPGEPDLHYYIGSLLAGHYHHLDGLKLNRLIATARENLLDPRLGIYNAFPMDFDQLIGQWNFQGNEAGDPGYYMNGGIWPQGNAWYALALIASGKQAEAFDFIRGTMTVSGIEAGPGGQPAMYEYRVSWPPDGERYGKVDKPQFLWSAGWLLYSLYHLFGIEENSWNLRLQPWLPDETEGVELQETIAGRLCRIRLPAFGEGSGFPRIRADDRLVPSAVFPRDLNNMEDLTVERADLQTPLLLSCEAVPERVRYHPDQRMLELIMEAFPGHRNQISIVSPERPVRFMVNGTVMNVHHDVTSLEGGYRIDWRHEHHTRRDSLAAVFE